MEFTIFEMAQAWREPPAKQGEQSKDMIARTASVGVMFVDVELRFVVEQAIKNVGRFALARADRQDAEIAILVGDGYRISYRARCRNGGSRRFGRRRGRWRGRTARRKTTSRRHPKEWRADGLNARRGSLL